MLRNADGGGGVSDFPDRSVTKVQGSMLSALRTKVRVGVQFPGKKHYVTLEWPLIKLTSMTERRGR